MNAGPQHRGGRNSSGKPWIIYTRVSTAQQADEGVSLEAQRAACVMELVKHGSPPHEVVERRGRVGEGHAPAGALQRCSPRSTAAQVAGVDRLQARPAHAQRRRPLRPDRALRARRRRAGFGAGGDRHVVGDGPLLRRPDRADRAVGARDHQRARDDGPAPPPRRGRLRRRPRARPAASSSASAGSAPDSSSMTNAHPGARSRLARVLEGWTLRKICDHLNARGIAPGSQGAALEPAEPASTSCAPTASSDCSSNRERATARWRRSACATPDRVNAGGERVAPAARSERVWRLAGSRAAQSAATPDRHPRARPARQGLPVPALLGEAQGRLLAPSTCRRRRGRRGHRVLPEGRHRRRAAARRAWPRSASEHRQRAERGRAQRGELALERDRAPAAHRSPGRPDRRGRRRAGKAVAPKLRELQTSAERLDVDIGALRRRRSPPPR
jgi:hypothetical protein